MSKNIINELEIKFNDFINEKDEYKFFLRLSKYFQFIENTFPLDNIIKKLFNSSSELAMFKNIEGLYNHITFGENPTKFSINPSSLSGSGIRTLHKRLIEEAKRSGVSGGFVIERNTDGGYTFNGATIPFSKKTIIYDVFDYLYNLPSHRASYSNIDKYLAKKGYGIKHNKEERSERIRNAVRRYNENKKEYSQIGGVSILEVEHNFGVKLNNPML